MISCWITFFNLQLLSPGFPPPPYTFWFTPCKVEFDWDPDHLSNQPRYLGDMLSTGGGCEITVTTHVKTAWKKLRELLPVLTSHHLPYKIPSHVYSSCVWNAMLHASETWPLTKTNRQRDDRVMIRQICSIKPEDVAKVRSSELLAKLEHLNLILREREGLAGLGMWSVQVVQSEQHVIYRLMAGRGQGGPS